MKNIGLLLISILFSTFAFSQTPLIFIEQDGKCNNYNLILDGTILEQTSECVFEAPQVDEGSSYTLQVESTNEGALVENLSTNDVVFMAQMLLGINEFDPLTVYKADLDQDGAVTTYDLIKLRGIIIFLIFNEHPTYHLVGPNTILPNEIDPFDIQVEYNTLEFTSNDFTNNQMKINVFKLGNLDGS